MEIFSGPASHVRHTAAVHGNKDGIGTSQGVTFRVNGRSVEMWSPTAPQIEDGDEVSVAGDLSDGVVRARAYMNHSSGAAGRRAKWSIPVNFLIYGVGGFFLTVIGVVVAGPVGLLVYPAVFVCWGWATRDELKTRRAVKLVRSLRPVARPARSYA